MLLENKVAVIYGAGGAIGGAVAQAFAREGATVYLAGRTEEKLSRVVDTIRSMGGKAEISEVDALHEDAVKQFVDKVIQQAGKIDISFNLISYGDIQRPLIELTVEEFLQPIMNAMRTQFLTTKAVIGHMSKRGSGVIMHFGGSGPQTLPGLGGFKVALDAMEGLRRQWAIEFGKQGIRAITLKTGGIVDSMPESTPGRDQIAASILESAMLNHTATLEDVGNVAAFVASDQARTMTSTEINISGGAIVD
jgi:3-oxoacyl-[acyl-carrier protein] reductase